LTNSDIYSAGFASIRNFFSLMPSQADLDAGLTAGSIFLERLPYVVFVIFSIVMAILCFIKRFSLIPVLGVMCCTYLMTELGWTNWFRFGLWLLIGLRIYRLYSFKNSKINFDGEKIVGVNLLSIVPVAIDTVIFGLLLIPLLRSQEFLQIDFLNLAIALVI